MSDEQVIQLCEYLHINMRSRKMRLVDNCDGTSAIKYDWNLHNAGAKIIGLVRLLEGDL